MLDQNLKRSVLHGYILTNQRPLRTIGSIVLIQTSYPYNITGGNVDNGSQTTIKKIVSGC